MNNILPTLAPTAMFTVNVYVVDDVAGTFIGALDGVVLYPVLLNVMLNVPE